jgi:diguanylate cyclase (GGDEF)-like protein/PAS domain S-box-containing protein
MAFCEEPLIKAALLAVDEINERGGLLGREVRAFVADGRSEDSTFAREAKGLIRDREVCSLFGCWTSSARKAVKFEVEEAEGLFWYPIQYEGLEESDHIVYMGSCMNQQIAPTIEWALAAGRRRIALVGSDYVFPRTANKLVNSMLTSTDASVVYESYHPLNCQNYESMLAPLSASQPDLIINTINGIGNLAFFEQLQTVPSLARPELVCSMSCCETLFSLVPGGAEGHLACWGYFGSLDTPRNRDFVAKLKRIGVLVSADPVATAYSQILLWASIVERIRSYDPADVLANLAGSGLDTPLGRLEIQENHHTLRDAFVGRLDAFGQFKILWHSDAPIAPLPWFGVRDADLPFRDLIMQVLKDLPEDVTLRGLLETEVEERRRLAAITEKNERRLKEAELIAGVGGFERDFKTGEGYWSDNLFNILGYAPGAFVPSLEAFWKHVHEDDQEEFQKKLAIAVFEAKDMTCQCRIRRADGEVRHIQVHAAVARDKSGAVDHYHGTMLDITERALAEEKMRFLAQTDELTGIYNRRYFIELAKKEIERANRYDSPFSLIMFDIDKFKDVNDIYGHDAGDEVIKAIICCGVAMARGVDFLGRLGGEEFAIALPQTDLKGAQIVAERVRIGVEHCDIVVQDSVLHCTVSLGVAELTGCANNFDSILKASDLAMYRAKNSGRNRVEPMLVSDLDIACSN